MDGVLKLGKSLEALPQNDEYVFDFSQFGQAEPFGMMFAAAIIQEFLARRGARLAGQNLWISEPHGMLPGDRYRARKQTG